MIRLNFNVESIITEQSLVDDSVNYQLIGNALGVQLAIPVPVTFIERLDKSLQAEQPRPPQPDARGTTPVGYDIGIVDDELYARGDDDDE